MDYYEIQTVGHLFCRVYWVCLHAARPLGRNFLHPLPQRNLNMASDFLESQARAPLLLGCKDKQALLETSIYLSIEIHVYFLLPVLLHPHPKWNPCWLSSCNSSDLGCWRLVFPHIRSFVFSLLYTEAHSSPSKLYKLVYLLQNIWSWPILKKMDFEEC